MGPNILGSDNSILITFLASFLIWFMLGGLAFLWIVDGRVKREEALHAFTSGILAWLIVMVIKSLLPEARPFQVYGVYPLTFTLPSSYSSFPSGHAAVAFAVATSVWIHNKKLGLRFIVLAGLVALGRVLSDAHFFGDILVGGLVGVITSFLLKKLHLFKLV